jgi:hypothetical protein
MKISLQSKRLMNNGKRRSIKELYGEFQNNLNVIFTIIKNQMLTDYIVKPWINRRLNRKELNT